MSGKISAARSMLIPFHNDNTNSKRRSGFSRDVLRFRGQSRSYKLRFQITPPPALPFSRCSA